MKIFYKMKRTILMLVLIPTAAICLCFKGEIFDNWKYLGQVPPRDKAELFAPEIIKHLAHSSPAFTPDGKEIYWSTVSENGEPRKIYFMRYENSHWSKPEIAPFSGKYHDDQPFISHDGQKMYFASKRPKLVNGPEELDIWISERAGRSWSQPKPIDKLIGFWTPSVTRTGTICFLDIIKDFQAKGYINQAGIFRSQWKNGAYSDPELLPEQINRKDSQNWCPFIAPDESYLIFSSDRDGGFGSGDLYICFRGKNGEWTEAVNMGETVNSEEQERFPGVSPDGKYLFFTRWYGEPNLHDLYWVDSGIIQKLRNQIPEKGNKR